MTRPAEWALALAAIAVSVAFTGGVSGWGRSAARGAASSSATDRYYHSGKGLEGVRATDGCVGEGCHVGFPHSRGLTLAPFRNMHVRFVECLACHATAAREAWVVRRATGRPGGGAAAGAEPRWIIGSARTGAAREKMHGLTGAALSCRACHSEEGARALAARGIKDLRAGFQNPVPLRMIEEGARQWIPDTMK